MMGAPSIREEQIRAALATVLDPELGLSVVELGLVYGIRVDGGVVNVIMTFTTPACPMGAYLIQSVKQAISPLEGVTDVDVELTFEPPWSLEKASKEIQARFGLLT
jgi:metal-sulfur cluster biosynthetic enzyme